MLDREDYIDLLKRQQKEKINGQKWNLEFLAQAQVHQKNLTGNPEWDRFLSYLTETGERLEENKREMESALCSPYLVNSDRIMEAKLALADVNGMLRMLEAVLSLPKDIIETGEKARERLKEID